MLNHSRKYKGRFIDDQRMFWLSVPPGQRQQAMEPANFIRGELCDRRDKTTFEGDPLDRKSVQPPSNPWSLVDRFSVLQQGRLPNGSAWQCLCVTVGAGVGKTTTLEKMEYSLAAEDPDTLCIVIPFANLHRGVNHILGTSAATAELLGDTPLLIAQMQKVKLGDSPMPGSIAWELIRRKIRQGKFTLLVDAMDQHKGGIQPARQCAETLRDFLLRYPTVRCVVSGRPFSVLRFWDELFVPILKWEFLQLGTFTEKQCQQRVGKKRWEKAKQLGPVNTGIPRWLDVLNEIDENNLNDLESLSDLYLRSIDHLLKDAIKEQAEAIRLDGAWYLFALLAWEMLTDPNGPYRSQGAGISGTELMKFKQRVWDDRAERTKHGFRFPGLDAEFPVKQGYEQFDQMLGRLGVLNEMLDDPVIYGSPNDPAQLTQIFWRDQSLMDMFAAIWVTRYAPESDIPKLRERLFIRWDKNTVDYESLWRFAAEMPLNKGGCQYGRIDTVYVRSMSVLYEPSKTEHPASRSTEMIWRSWKKMKCIAKLRGPSAKMASDALKGFLGEYPAILSGSRGFKIRQICENFETWFVDIDPNPTGWKTGDRDVDGNLLPIVTKPYRIAKCTATNELYGLFDSSLFARYEAYGTPLRRIGSSQAYGDRARAPVICSDWYDAWASALWFGCQLPHDRQWEFACRAGQRDGFSLCSSPSLLFGVLTKSELSLGLRGSELPIDIDCILKRNAWSLDLISGNVLEWCRNWYDGSRKQRCVRAGSFGLSSGKGLWQDVKGPRHSSIRAQLEGPEFHFDVGVRFLRAARD